MARASQIKIEGLTELTSMMAKVKATSQGHEVRAALLASAQMIEQEAKTRAPIAPYPTYYKGRFIAPGGLRASFRSAAGRQSKNFLQAFTFAGGNRAPHAHLVEYGTKPHVITPQLRGKLLKFGNRFTAFAKSVQHPGSRPQPFMRNSVRAKRGAVKRLLEMRVKEAFDALARAA